MMRLRQCCCGCKLKTGTIIFLVSKAVFAMYQLYLTLLELKKDNLPEIHPARFSYITYNFVSALVMIIACCTGIRVITKSRAKFLVPFICCQFSLFLCYFAFFIWFWFKESLYFTELLKEVSKLILDENTENTIYDFLRNEPYVYTIVIFTFLGLNVYFTLVVYNYCIKLRNEASFGCPDVYYSRAPRQEIQFTHI